ncbi:MULTISPECIES: ABC transporter permease [Microtetraspora]|uniref:ABC transporter permease n=1 Tax=Microtetraspora glauca TaxID=1996 RepID=A0ABV3GU04_MICGL|nr:ABC transporter permease [Microtetraspora fusca]
MNRGLDLVLRRTAVALITIFCAISLNFLLFRVVPGDAVSNLARVPNSTVAQQQALRHEFGLDRSIGVQYVAYLRELAHGNLGRSFANGQPVSKNLGEALGNTLPMVLLGTVVAILAGIATGVLGAVRRGTRTDRALTVSSLTVYALPAQWVGLLLLFLLGGVFPSGGRVDEFLIEPSPWQHTVDVLWHMTLPSLVVGLTLFGQYALLTRTAMLETLAEDYVLTARAKGLSTLRIVRHHALRNAMLPISTLIALSLGSVVGGVVLIETVFSWPGIGRAIYSAVTSRDYPMLQGAFLVLTVVVVVCNYVSDLIYLRLDPRITV